VSPRGAILCVQPFADEANLSRRVLVAQARRLAVQGWTTLLIDLYGTCDSAGRSDEANLAAWRSDLLRASHLVRARAGGHFVLWGLRLGALLACDVAIALDQITSAMVFWQPSPTGKHALDALLRLGRVGGLARGASGAAAASAATVGVMAESPAPGAGVDVTARSPAPGTQAGAMADSPAPVVNLGGYQFASQLITDLSELQLQPVALGEGGRACPVLMLGLQRVAGSDTPPPRLLSTLADRWIAEGYPAMLQVAQSEPFWSAMEPSTPVAAFEATEAFLRGLDERA
jgi:pimeloyl-ACP methyl ester carboxylesterase